MYISCIYAKRELDVKCGWHMCRRVPVVNRKITKDLARHTSFFFSCANVCQRVPFATHYKVVLSDSDAFDMPVLRSSSFGGGIFFDLQPNFPRHVEDAGS